MNEKDLKKVIKQLVRESLAELFCEMHLETIVEGVIKKQVNRQPIVEDRQKSFSSTLKEQVAAIEESEKKVPVQSKEDLRRMIRERVGADDGMADIYADTIQHGNSVLSEKEDAGKPELVPESVLIESGLMKDYSRFVK